MNGYEHYQRAEEILGKWSSEYGAVPEMVALAQVHATLALAAATADATSFRRDLYAGNGRELPTRTRADAKNERLADAARAFLD